MLKNEILEELESNREKYVSGQALAEKFGVSRNAVWKAIKLIKSDGYKIDSVNNKGYRLASSADILSAGKITENMSENSKKLKLIVFDTIDSTNNEAKRMIADGFRENALIVSNEQTNGRGRLGRDFYSPKNTGIYMSFVFHTDLKLSDAVSVTTAAAVAVVRAIERLTDIKPQIKWVNDVYVGDKKACGILTEAVSDFETGLAQSIVIGIGINISTEEFPDEINSTATSLNFSGLSRNNLIAAVCDELVEICSDLSDKSYIESYREHSLIIGKEIDFYRNNVRHSATAVDIDSDGGLIVRFESGETEVLSSGEVTVRLSK